MVRHPQRIMSDLQDAIKEWEDFWIWANDDPPEHQQTVVEAARKYADPYIDAAHQSLVETLKRNGLMKLPGFYDDGERAVHTALGVTEAPDGQ